MNQIIENVVKTVHDAKAWDEVRNEMQVLAFRAGFQDEWSGADEESRPFVIEDIEDALRIDLNAAAKA